MAEPIKLTEEEKKKANKGCSTILIIAVAIFGVWYFTKSDDKKEVSTSSSDQYQNSSTTSTAPTTSTPSSSSASNSAIEDKDPYEVIHVAFEGFPDKEVVQPMMEAVMKRYNMTITNDNILKVGNMLVVLKKESVVGVTEMDILKHIYQKGSSSITLPEQAGISSVLLEQSK